MFFLYNSLSLNLIIAQIQEINTITQRTDTVKGRAVLAYTFAPNNVLKKLLPTEYTELPNRGYILICEKG